MSKDTTITIAGKAYPVTLPDFATRDDIVIAWHEAAGKSDASKLRRVAAAAIGLVLLVVLGFIERRLFPKTEANTR